MTHLNDVLSCSTLLQRPGLRVFLRLGSYGVARGRVSGGLDLELPCGRGLSGLLPFGALKGRGMGGKVRGGGPGAKGPPKKPNWFRSNRNSSAIGFFNSSRMEITGHSQYHVICFSSTFLLILLEGLQHTGKPKLDPEDWSTLGVHVGCTTFGASSARRRLLSLP